MKYLFCSIGVIVYNEAANIGKLLDSLLTQKTEKVSIKEIIVVSSACTDGTDDIVRSYTAQDDRIKLITEPERGGKSSAINKFIKAAESDILIIESGDTIPAVNTVEKMVSPFADPIVGMTGGRPTPENDPSTFVGYAVNLLWNLHHEMALISPKLGEMVAFRKIFDQIPPESAVDEASIEAIIKAAGMEFKINLITPDNKEKHLIELSNATLNNIEGFQDENADLTVTINRSDLDLVMMGVKTLDDMIADGTAKTKGDKSVIDASEFLGHNEPANPIAVVCG